MKAIIIILLLGFTLSYEPKAAIAYARKYCNKYNPYYENYQEKKEVFILPVNVYMLVDKTLKDVLEQIIKVCS